MRLVRAPAVHFLLIGGVLHLLAAAWPGVSTGVIAVHADDLARLQREWRAESGRPPTPPELRASLQRYLDDEILLAEALRLELDQRDRVVRQRLIENLRFAFPGGGDDVESRLAQARTLGMPASDLVVRRRLIQLMEHRLVGEVAVDEVRLRDYVNAHAARYAAPTRLSFRQVFYSRDRLAGDARAAAEGALPVLQAAPDAPTAAFGDPFLLGESAVAATPDVLARRYGSGFARAVADFPVGVWSGPLESAYGWHLVRIDAREAAGMPDFEAVRVRAAYAWRAEEERRVLQQRLQPLRRRYGVASIDELLEWLHS